METNKDPSSSLSLLDRFRHAQSLIATASSSDNNNNNNNNNSQGESASALTLLTQLQHDVASLSLFSSNDTLDDISTKALPLLGLEYALGRAQQSHSVVPPLSSSSSSSTASAHPVSASAIRYQQILKSQNCFGAFLQRLEQLELLTPEQTRAYHALLEHGTIHTGTTGQQPHDGNDPTTITSTTVLPLVSRLSRDETIARFRAKQQLQSQRDYLEALQQRRNRFEVESHHEMDGYDGESLERHVALSTLSLWATEALEEWQHGMREIPMLQHAMQLEQDRAARERHSGADHTPRGGVKKDMDRNSSNTMTRKPFQLTHITKDVTTGQLHMRKEELQSQVFRPGWNQPTMTLQELGALEYAQAKERDARQQQAEASQANQPRRYDQLVRDGKEDDADLVDASAALDRAWDDFREQNPKGSGNKMGDRGDRNF